MPVYERLFSDRITPVLAYRTLVPAGDHTSPSFLLESVSNGSVQVLSRSSSLVSSLYHGIGVGNSRAARHSLGPACAPACQGLAHQRCCCGLAAGNGPRIAGRRLTGASAGAWAARLPGVQARPATCGANSTCGRLQGRYSFVGARPALEVIAREDQVTVVDHMAGTRTVSREADPLAVPQRLGAQWRPVTPEDMPPVFTGGWVGYCGYDTVRYTYASAPPDRVCEGPGLMGYALNIWPPGNALQPEAQCRAGCSPGCRDAGCILHAWLVMCSCWLLRSARPDGPKPWSPCRHARPHHGLLHLARSVPPAPTL